MYSQPNEGENKIFIYIFASHKNTEAVRFLRLSTVSLQTVTKLIRCKPQYMCDEGDKNMMFLLLYRSQVLSACNAQPLVCFSFHEYDTTVFSFLLSTPHWLPVKTPRKYRILIAWLFVTLMANRNRNMKPNIRAILLVQSRCVFKVSRYKVSITGFIEIDLKR
jgi:hypothetical protein